MKSFVFILAGLVRAIPYPPKHVEVELAGDVRYTCESAAYWRNLGLAIDKNDITEDCVRYKILF